MDSGANFAKWAGSVIFGVDNEDTIDVFLVFRKLETDSFVDAPSDTVAPDGTL